MRSGFALVWHQPLHWPGRLRFLALAFAYAALVLLCLGVLRAASFMGLGVALIGIAYLYQRVVFRREAP